MKTHIVLAHPEASSFNGHLAGISQSVLSAAGDHATLSDLYSMDFNPREGAQHYTARKDEHVSCADRAAFQRGELNHPAEG
ncbi:MAG: flavodoxin family protein, partial [Rhizobiales bacterium]|nr:flavodoxin family protein [Hyphomicrobiales bacterium]